jgi:hypothetical protein
LDHKQKLAKGSTGILESVGCIFNPNQIIHTEVVDVAIQLQALLTRLAAFPVHAAAANVGRGTVALGEAVNVPQKALASTMRSAARRARRQLSELQVCAETEARLPKAKRLLMNFMLAVVQK